MFWQIWLFQSQSTAILLPSRFLKSFNFFSEKAAILFQRTQTLKILRDFILSVSFDSKTATFNDFQNLMFFFGKPFFFKRRTKFLNTLRNLTISVPMYSKVSIFSNFEEAQDFFEKPIVFKQKPNFEPFEKFDYSSRFIQQICYLHMFKSFQVLFRKTIVFVRNYKFLTFLENFLC